MITRRKFFFGLISLPFALKFVPKSVSNSVSNDSFDIETIFVNSKPRKLFKNFSILVSSDNENWEELNHNNDLKFEEKIDDFSKS